MQFIRVAIWLCLTVFCFWWVLAYPEDNRNKIPFTEIPLAWLALGVTLLHSLRLYALQKKSTNDQSFHAWRERREHASEEGESMQEEDRSVQD